MIGLVFAMEEEAKQVLSAYEMEKVNIRGRDFYVEQGNPDHDKILAVIAGIGKVNVQVATSLLITLGCNKLINISTCGCTSDLYKPGDLVIRILSLMVTLTFLRSILPQRIRLSSID